MRKRHARRGKVAVRRPIQRSHDGQRDKLGKLPPRLVVLADRPQRHYGFTSVLRDLEVESFVCRSRVSGQVFESFHDGRRSRGKVKKDTDVSQIHLRRDVQPEERIVRFGCGEL
jgi:hypothetical protein